MREDQAAGLRERLAAARLMCLFGPELCGGREPLGVLERALPWIDVVQVRPKPPGSSRAQAARESRDWCLRVLELVERSRLPTLVLVNDRVDVARTLRDCGLAGVHLGQEDCPPKLARELLGALPLIGLSTHDLVQVARASEEPIDYLGFGPIHPSATKGYERGLGCELAWVAQAASSLPVFPIGGIDLANAHELAGVGRAALSQAILAAEDPARAARGLRAVLEAADGETPDLTRRASDR
jgi:thiamine-phosphate diphosphorylase